jgi:flagellar M-ring protein FliF
MAWSDYWGALTARQRMGLIVGMVLVAVTTLALAVWLLRDPYVPFARDLSAERMSAISAELDRARVGFRVEESGNAIAVPRSQLGKARAATAVGLLDSPPSVGLELFKETDFSSTDFAQRINYQRALQGELVRTIQTISGVKAARVHVILPDGGLFKRAAAKATAAVSVSLQPGRTLTPLQVRGIQRLVAASVPEIKIDDVVVLDESGTSLTRASGEAEGEASAAQLDLKRQADQYLEGKIQRLLQDLVPRGNTSVSVDAVLDERQLRVTTDEPIAARSSKEGDRAAGVLVKERQSQRGQVAGLAQADGEAGDENSSDWEHEYIVGHRTEQSSSAPGAIKHISVAVAIQGAPAALSSADVEQLVANAAGLDRTRGDSVRVLMLPVPSVMGAATERRADGTEKAQGDARRVLHADDDDPAVADEVSGSSSMLRALQAHAYAVAVVLLVVLGALMLAIVWVTRSRGEPVAAAAADPNVDIEAVATRVRQWLNEGGTSGRA